MTTQFIAQMRYSRLAPQCRSLVLVFAVLLVSASAVRAQTEGPSAGIQSAPLPSADAPVGTQSSAEALKPIAPVAPAADSDNSRDAAEARAPVRPGEPLQLDTMTIKAPPGLPRVLYIVPWKRATAGDLPGRPAGSLVDEALTPVNRTEFRRELNYTADLGPNSSPANGPVDAGVGTVPGPK
jgi:hypothetical protein